MKDTVRSKRQTLSMGTETTEGFIRHKLMTVGGVTFEAPVQIERHEVWRGEYIAVARRHNGALLYALPGGNVYAEGT